MNFYKKTMFIFVLIVFFFAITIKLLEPVLERQIKNYISDKKLSEKIKKELLNSVDDFTPEKKEFYKKIIKKGYLKWKPLIEESINEANKELDKN